MECTTGLPLALVCLRSAAARRLLVLRKEERECASEVSRRIGWGLRRRALEARMWFRRDRLVGRVWEAATSATWARFRPERLLKSWSGVGGKRRPVRLAVTVSSVRSHVVLAYYWTVVGCPEGGVVAVGLPWF